MLPSAEGDASPASLNFSYDTCHDTMDGHAGQGLEVLVVFTDWAGTEAALHLADGLAQKLEAHLHLIVPYEVPYALPLSKPAVPVKFLEGRVRELAARTYLEITAHIYLCRHKERVLSEILQPHSMVVVGGKKRWWTSAAQRLARRLERSGHHVIFAKQR